MGMATAWLGNPWGKETHADVKFPDPFPRQGNETWHLQCRGEALTTVDIFF